MSISSLFLEVRQSSFIRDWSEIRKLEIAPCAFEFCAIFGNWTKLEIPNLVRMSPGKYQGYIYQNTIYQYQDYKIPELLSKNKQLEGGGVELPPFPHPVRLIPKTWKDNNFLPSLYFTICVVKRYSITEKQRSAYNSLLLISILQITLKNIKKILQVEDIYENFDRLQNWRNLKLQNFFSIFYVFS